MILGNPYLFCTGNGNVELWKNLGSYENGAGREHSDATHIRARTNHAISQISPPERLEVLMHEVFSKTTDPNVPLQEQEYFELRLDDLGTPFRPKFIDSLGAVVRHRFPPLSQRRRSGSIVVTPCAAKRWLGKHPVLLRLG